MADTISLTCPKCSKKMQVPEAVAGKKIRCKGCETVIAVPAKSAKPPAAAAAPSPPPPPAKRNDDDEDNNPYGRIEDDLDIARCPFCAVELDPPDTKICLNCGYDLIQRRRHESKKIHAYTQGDWVKHLLPGIGMLLLACVFIAVIVLALIYMPSLFTEIGLQDDKENPITLKKEYVVPPGACTMPVVVFSLFMIYKCGLFAIKRLFINYRPPERKKAEK